MKIAMIGSRGIGSNYGGIERCLDELCPRLVALGHEVDVYAAKPIDLDLPAGLRSIAVPGFGGKYCSNLSRSLMATLRAVGRYDVVHFHATGPGILAAIAKLRHQRSLVTVHALDQDRDKWGPVARQSLRLAERTVALCADELTVVSESLRRYMRERHDRIARCLPNGLPDKRRVAPGALLERHGLEAGRYWLFASRLTPEKGCHDLIAAFNVANTGGLRLAIAGGNGSQEYLLKLRSLADPARVVFLGHLEGEALAEAFSNARAFVLPSYVEGMSIALLEAIAYGLPVLVSDIEANALVVGEPGCRFPPGDVASLADALEVLSAGRPMTGREACRRLVGWDAVARQYDAVYRSMMDRRAGVPPLASYRGLPS